MAVTADSVVIDLEARLDKYTDSVRTAERQFGRSMDNIERYAAQNERKIRDLGEEYEDLGRKIGESLRAGSRAAQIAFAAIAAYAIKLASDAAEIDSAFEVAFKNTAANAKAFSETLASKVGRDAVVLREEMTKLQLVLTGTGVAAEQAEKLVESLTLAGVDAGSLFNTSDAEALQKIISGITGEAEPLKAFGVVLTEAAVKAELLSLGFKGNTEQASEAAKSIARANLILKGLAVANGDAARTADSAANKTRAMKAQFDQAARALGQELLPVFIKVTGAVTDTLKAFNDMPDGLKVASLAILGFIAASGPIAGLIANLVKVIQLANAAKVSIAGIGGASAGSAAAGAVGGSLLASGGAAGGIGLVGIGAGSVILRGQQYKATMKDLRKASDDALRAAQKEAQGEIRSLQEWDKRTGRANSPGALVKYLADNLAIATELGRRAAKAGVTPVATGVVGGFGLPEGLKSPTDAAKVGRGGRSGSSRPTEDRAPVISPVTAQEDFTPRETVDFTNFISVEEMQAAADEFARQLEQESHDRLYDGVRGALEAAADGDILDYFASHLRAAALNGLAEGLTQALTQAASSGGRSGGLISAGLRFFGFGRAAGGHVVGGKYYPVNERGHLEGFVAPQSGRIVPLGNVRAAPSSAGGGSVTMNLRIDLDGANGDETIRRIAYDAAATGARQAYAQSTQAARRNAPAVMDRFNKLGTT